jgi:methyl-accepting chemotaxis protein
VDGGTQTGPQTRRFQRKTFLIKRRLQLKYAALVFAGVLFTAVIVGGDISWTMLRFIERENPSLITNAMDVMRFTLVKMSLFMGIMSIVSLFVSHRLAGPVYRFEKSARAIASGDLTHRVCLRTGDELMELQDEINSMTASLQRLVQRDRVLADALAERLGALAGRLKSPGARPEEAAAEIEAVRGGLAGLTRGFKA